MPPSRPTAKTIQHSLRYGRQVTIEKRPDEVLYDDRLPDRLSPNHGRINIEKCTAHMTSQYQAAYQTDLNSNRKKLVVRVGPRLAIWRGSSGFERLIQRFGAARAVTNNGASLMNSTALLQKSSRLAVERVASELPLSPSTACISVAISAKRRCAGTDDQSAIATTSAIGAAINTRPSPTLSMYDKTANKCRRHKDAGLRNENHEDVRNEH